MAPEPDALLSTEEPDWIAAARAGDRGAFAKLVELYWDRLYRWLYHLTRDRHRAEDLVQETFLKALAGLDTFRPGSNFRAWLFRIGHNNFVNLTRTDRRGGGSLPETIEDPAASAPDVAADREALRAVADAVAALPPDFRAAMLLRAEQGLSFKEIAAILKTTEETARWRVFKARQKLLQALPADLLPPGREPDDRPARGPRP